MEGEVLVNATQSSNKVIFEGLDGTFSGIVVMDSGQCKLGVNVFLAQKLFQGFSTFIVKALEVGLKAGGTQFGMEIFVASKDGGASTIFDGSGKNVVAVIVIANEQIIVAMAGWGVTKHPV
jgi:hypothetical protein